MMFDSLYVHVPFCAKKCDYCAFYSEPLASQASQAAYLIRLEQEFRRSAKMVGPFCTVYIGGGTPNFLSPVALERLFASINQHFSLREGAEWTVECNPDSLSAEHIAVFAASGVTRVSLGIQSFSHVLRRNLGRQGKASGVGEHIRALMASGIKRISVDLMYAIPGQRMEDWQQDLHSALRLGVEHLSAYAVTREPGTPFAKRWQEDMFPNEDSLLAMWKLIDDICAQYGLTRYEVSNFSKPEAECQHNMKIWHGATYLGCGPAAVSFDGTTRWSNPSNLLKWLHEDTADHDFISPEARAAEILAFGLRTVCGWDMADFASRTGMSISALRGDAVKKLIEYGLLKCAEGRIFPTEKGLLLNDCVLADLL